MVEKNKVEKNKEENKKNKLLLKIKEKLENIKDIAKKTAIISSLTIFIIIGGAKCADSVIEPPVIEVKDTEQDGKTKLVKDVENKDVEKDCSNGDVENDVYFVDVEENEGIGDTNYGEIENDVNTNDQGIQDGGQSDAFSDNEISDTQPPNYTCEIISTDLDKKPIEIIYEYYDKNDKPVVCNASIDEINKIKISIDGGIEQTFADPFEIGRRAINMCFPTHNICDQRKNEKNKADENNIYSFSQGLEVQFQMITPYREGQQDPLKLLLVIPRIEATIKCKGGPIPGQNFEYIDDVLYACLGVKSSPIGDAGYDYFANAQNVILKNGGIFCGPDNKCGKQLSIDEGKQNTTLRTLWNGMIVVEENTLIRIAYPTANGYTPNQNGQECSISGYNWIVSKLDIEKNNDGYILKGMIIQKE